ncbi:hypothetical protein ACA910_007312 [Epithemia clementina (nom. ined.)]
MVSRTTTRTTTRTTNTTCERWSRFGAITLLLLFLLGGHSWVQGFSTQPTTIRTTTTTTSTPLRSFQPLLDDTRRLRRPTTCTSTTTTLFAAARRRETLAWLRHALLGGLAIVGGGTSARAQAEELPPPESAGRSVTFTVDNLQGEPGRTGTFTVRLQPSWAPRGVERFEELTSIGFWNNCRVFRVLPGFVVQFGINGDPAIQSEWRSRNIRDDPPVAAARNKRGTVVFATAGPNTRTTQIFINTRDNDFLDRQGFTPIGYVTEGMEDVVDQMYAGYGEGAPSGQGPNQGRIQLQGNSYLSTQFPKLSFIRQAVFGSNMKEDTATPSQ